MESDSTLLGLLLVISTVSLSLTSLADKSLKSVRRERALWLNAEGIKGSQYLVRLQSLPFGPSGILSPLRLLFLVASVVCAATLSLYVWGDSWSSVIVISLVVLGLLGIIHVLVCLLAETYGEVVALKISQIGFMASVPLSRVPFLSRMVGLAMEEVNLDEGYESSDLAIPIDPDGDQLDEREARMIRGVVRLDKTIAREIMVPRVDMVAAEIGTPLEKIGDQMVESGHSRVPVYDESLDQIRGIAYSRDILAHLSGNGGVSLGVTTKVIRPALFIPESKTLEELLSEFQQSQVHMAIVVDEYGGVSGLVTIEDLLEEIVGEINDEFDIGEPEIVTISDGVFLLDAGVSIDQIDDLLNVRLEGDGFDTMGGFLYQRLGKIPSVGDVVEYGALKIEVVSTLGRRLKKLRITREPNQ